MKSQCDNCDWTGEPAVTLTEITGFRARIEPGGIVPSGECPKCGALCYPAAYDQAAVKLAKDALPLLRQFQDICETGKVHRPDRLEINAAIGACLEILKDEATR